MRNEEIVSELAKYWRSQRKGIGMNNFQNKANFVWQVADDILRGAFKQHEYGEVILPFVVLRRLDCVLEDCKDAVIVRQYPKKHRSRRMAHKIREKMMKESKKPKWERVGDSFDLLLTNPRNINIRKVRKLLEKVELPNPEYDKPFNKDASRLFHQWFNDPKQPLKEAPYVLLSNWFLTNCSASKSSRADHARELWDTLFCSRPDRRLTSPKKDHKILKEEFDLWWPKQQKCQKDC